MIELFKESPHISAIIMFSSFLLAVINISSLFHKSIQKNLLIKIVLLICCVITSFMTVIYAGSILLLLEGVVLNSVCKWVMQMLVLPLMIIITNFAFLVFVFVKEYYYRKNFITLSTVKESFDYLPTGLCFSKPNGMILLVNYKMIELCYEMFGVYIQNADEFWKNLCSGNTLDEIENLTKDEQPEYRLPDSSVWSFKKEKIDSVVQITASEITHLYELTNQLKNRNKELAAMNKRLRKYGESVDETTRTKERLETKMRIHNELGQSLIATRHCIKMNNGDYKAIFDMWKRNIAVLRMEAEPQQNPNQLQSVIKAAEAVGVTINIKGNLPTTQEAEKLFISATTEALTNAVKYAGAKELNIEADENEGYYVIRFTNDGTKPENTIREGGGLSSLRRKIERACGEMKISSKPEFLLCIKLQKEVNLFD